MTKMPLVMMRLMADVTMIYFVLQAAKQGKSAIICVLNDDTGVSVLLVHWVHRVSRTCKVQNERWAGAVLHINATCSDLGTKVSNSLAYN